MTFEKQKKFMSITISCYQEQADDSAGFKARAPEPNEFRRHRKMQLADFLAGSFKRSGKRSNLQDEE